MRKIMLFAVVLTVMATASAFAAVQTWNWDFNDGTFGGWTISGTGANVATKTGSWFDTTGYGLQAHLPGTGVGTAAYMDLASLGIQNSQSFRFEALVSMEDASKRIQACGLGVSLGTDAGDSFWMEGKSTSSSNLIIQRSSTGANYFTGSSNWDISNMIKPFDGSATPAGFTMKMVVSYNEPGVSDGVFRYEFYSPNYTLYQYTYATPVQPRLESSEGWLGVGTGVWVLKTDTTTGKFYQADRIRFGGDWSKTDAYFDAVKFTAFDATTLPEPGSILAMFTGLVGFVGFARRKK